ncbi:MAG TPA: tRNA uracil 4-sulfurtransferase ThiI [Bacteroidota bacterium]|nr:tRNA uracil 4-sulfurtransferase ThiI [Bacteroidota bacterium]
MKPVIVVHHHEITLKGENRPFFERQLLQNVKRSLARIVPSSAIRGGYGKFIIDVPAPELTNSIVDRLTKVFGLANICSGVRVEQDIGVISRTAEKLLENQEFHSIKVHTRRSDKRFPIGSMEVNARVGEYLCERFKVRANLTQPDETIYIEIVDGDAYVYLSKIQGPGGLPVGVSGKVVGLISAGFDSPVASWQLMKRGASVLFVHFHSMPYTSEHSVEQVRCIVEALTTYQFRSKLYLVPFAEVQNEIVLHTPSPLRVILYRRMMVRIGEHIARENNAEALVTGEAVGQVASQTLRNIRIINDVATLPILRPLSGMDKEETMAIAKKIGTYDISKEPYDDCCSYLAPRKPSTWAKREDVEAAESALHIPKLIELAINNMTYEVFTFPKIKHAEHAETSIV